VGGVYTHGSRSILHDLLYIDFGTHVGEYT
jgi:hypothetical protein